MAEKKLCAVGALCCALILVSACKSPLDPGQGEPDLAMSGPGPDGAAPACEPPDLLIILDRTLTMHRTPDGMTPADTPEGRRTAKLHQAITAIEALMASGLDRTIRFGLELFPLDPGGGACDTLSERIQGRPTTNPSCQEGQVVLEPDLMTGARISEALDPETTRLCNTTPTGEALRTGKALLDRVRAAGRPQFIMLVTDGADFYDSCPEPDPLVVLRQLSAAGIQTFLIGFGAQTTQPGGVNPPLMNRLACAGRTARGFATACKQVEGGYDAVDPDGARLYYDATNGQEVQGALRTIATMVCCGCVG